MIKNDREYRITKTQIEKFEKDLAEVKHQIETDGRWEYVLERDAIEGQLSDLYAEVCEYEELLGSNPREFKVTSIADLPPLLVRARVASGMTQKKLAEKLGLHEQQVQRYEATDYASARLGRIIQVAEALGLGLPESTVFVQNAALQSVLNRLSEMGFNREFVMKRFYPKHLSSKSSMGLLQMASNIQHVYGIDAAQLLSDEWIEPQLKLTGTGRFKLPSHISPKEIQPYVGYSEFLARALLDISPYSGAVNIPVEYTQFRDAVLANYPDFSYKNVLNFVWDIGIPVLPLNDSGGFHGACWRYKGRNVIVLKQRTRSNARWMFDLLHEVWHAAQQSEVEERSVIDYEEENPDAELLEEERRANFFAGQVTLDGKAEELVEKCVRRARGSVERLKSIVPSIAQDNNVSNGALANYLAFRLSLQGINWWGAAHNLQEHDQDPWGISRDVLVCRSNIGNLGETERTLMLQALYSQGVM